MKKLQKSFDFCDYLPYNKELVQLIQKNDIELLTIFADKLKSYLKQFLYIGGMPEIVDSYAKNKDYNEVRRKQKIYLWFS